MEEAEKGDFILWQTLPERFGNTLSKRPAHLKMDNQSVATIPLRLRLHSM